MSATGIPLLLYFQMAADYTRVMERTRIALPIALLLALLASWPVPPAAAAAPLTHYRIEAMIDWDAARVCRRAKR